MNNGPQLFEGCDTPADVWERESDKRVLDHDDTSRYATLVHELGHLYCGHLGTPHDRWWPDRRGLTQQVEEFEAESVAYLVCHRVGILPTSDQYLSGHLAHRDLFLSCETCQGLETPGSWPTNIVTQRPAKCKVAELMWNGRG